MAYKMKGSPAKMGTIQGTAAHTSALKMRVEQNAASALKQGDASMSANELVAIRKELKEKAEKLAKRKEEGKVTFFGKRRRRKTQEKIDQNQALIDKNPDAIKWKKDAERPATPERPVTPERVEQTRTLEEGLTLEEKQGKKRMMKKEMRKLKRIR